MTAPPDDTGTDWTGYPRWKPNPIVHLIRWAWSAWLVYVGLMALFVLGLFLSDGAWRSALPANAANVGAAAVRVLRVRRLGANPQQAKAET